MNYTHQIPTAADLEPLRRQAAEQMITHITLILHKVAYDKQTPWYHHVTGLDVSVDIHKAMAEAGAIHDNLFSPEPGIAIGVYLDHAAPFHTIKPRIKKS